MKQTGGALQSDEACLGGLRVIDLTGRRGGYCGRLLAGLGADVVLVEPPGGDPTRSQGPFAKAEQHIEASLSFAGYHTGKRGIVLDLEDSKGASAFRGLVRTADVLIEDRAPGYLARLGLDYAQLRRINSRLVMASLTGFGRTGPYANFKSTNIVSVAMGGLMSTAGFPERPPLQGPGEAAHKLASVHATFGILVALFNRNGSGRGQFVEVSEQEVLAADPFRRMVLDYSVRGELVQRDGTVSNELFAGSYPAADGYVNLYVQAPSHWRHFVEWLGSPPEISDPSFESEEVQQKHRAVIDRLTIAKTHQYNKATLSAELQGQHVAAGPINTVGEFLNDEQTAFRNFVTEVTHPGLGRIRQAGDPYVMSLTPWRIDRGAPALDQHHNEVLLDSKRHSSWTSSHRRSDRPLLEGIRVVTFPTGVVGPCIGRLLGDHGAEVIAIEAKEKPSPSGEPKPVNAWNLAQVESNRSTKRVSLNMSMPEGRRLAEQIIAHADVVAENYSSRVLKKWNLDYPNVCRIKPDIVMISLQSFGNVGPKSSWISYGSTLLAYSGYSLLWQDSARSEQGVGCNTYFPDYVAPSYGAMAIMAALNHKARTGKGQYIDLSQAETAAAFLSTETLQWLATGHESMPPGNRSDFMAPHGCYECRGVDRWCVIAVEDEQQWDVFCGTVGHPEWITDSRFATLAGRLEHGDELDSLVSEWTRGYTPHQVMLKLQRAGVAAGVVANSEDLYIDPHMRERGFTHDVANEAFGWMTQVGRSVNLSETRGAPIKPAVEIGANNEDVLVDLLGLTRTEIQELEAKGAFG